MSAVSGLTCSSCGTRTEGRFCRNCGQSLIATPCPGCGAKRDAGARFCASCGRAATPGATGDSGRPQRSVAMWLLVGALGLVAAGAVVWSVAGRGASEDQSPGSPGVPPDISQLSPRERFDRLFNRIMTAAENGNVDETRTFLPMARMAYAQLDTVDIDARYHIAMLELQGDSIRRALAQADTIAAEAPRHLFALLIREAAAVRQGDQDAAARARRALADAYDAEIALERPEYAEHQAALDRFREDSR